MFKIIKKDKNTEVRLGVLTTPHGVVKTPAYVIVATYGQIKCLKPSDIKKTKTQIVIANTYHLWPEATKIKNEKLKMKNLGRESFILDRLGTKLPTMTDSGGFQVFSLASGRHNKAGKIFPRGTAETQKKTENIEKEMGRKNVRVTNRGVYFKNNNKWDDLRCRPIWQFLGPELSMKIQQKLDADIIFAFDECTSFFDDFKYNKKAMERTHRWAMQCLKTKANSPKPGQSLFGIVQGGKFKSLRIKSAKFIGSLPFDGFGIGGSFGKEEMVKMLKWVIPHLPEEKPRHLLGVGRIEDIFRAVENGIDLFDCVIPTREARHGRIWTKHGPMQITRGIYAKDKKKIEKDCRCPACQIVTRTKLHKLFKNRLSEFSLPGKRYATIHNVYFFNNLMEKIRDSIQKGQFKEFKMKILKKLKTSKLRARS